MVAVAAAPSLSHGEEQIQCLAMRSVAQTLTATANCLCIWYLLSQLFRSKRQDRPWGEIAQNDTVSY